MANVIKHKRGSGSDPAANNLVLGELAIRTDTGKLFTKMDSGAIAEIAGGGSDIAINTLSSSSATGGGSATFNGSAYRFTLSAPPNVSAAQLLVSINGVIQKPVAGTGQPSEGFSVDGTDIILGDAPATGSDFFILTFKSLGVSEPADNSVTSAKIVDGAIVNADINASANITGTKILPNFGSQNITTTGTLACGDITSSDGNGNLTLKDNNHTANNTEHKISFTASDNTELINFTSPFGEQHLRLRHGSTELVKFETGGNVLVGLTTGLSTQTGSIQAAGPIIAKSYINAHTSNATVIEYISNVSKIRAYGATSGSGQLAFNVGGGGGGADFEAMRISNDGKVGINIASSDNISPVRNLDIADPSGAILRLISSDDSLGVNERLGEIEFFTDDDDGGHIGSFIKAIADPSDSFGRRTALLFGTQSAEAQNAVEMMRLTASGRLGISTTNPAAKLGIGDTGNNGGLSELIKLGNDSSGSGTGCQINMGASSGNSSTSGCIAGFFDGTGTAVSILTSAAYGSSGAVERFRVDSSGLISVNTTDADNFLMNLERSHQVLKCDCTGSGDVIGAIFRHGRGGLAGYSGKMVSFRGNDNTEEGSIVIGTTATAYNTSSDYRLKENQVAIPDGITRLKALKPYQFNFKKDPNVKVDGFFAHEVTSVVPVAVTGLKDAVVTQTMIDNEEYEKEELGNPIYQGIDHSKLVPLLVAALQEAIGRIEVLEAK